MPIYEYRCGSCGNTVEAIQKIGADPLRTCPACNLDELTKLVSASSFRLKGGGWYETDFKSGNKKHIADKSDSDPGKSKADTATPAAKTSDASSVSSKGQSSSDVAQSSSKQNK